MDGRTAACAGDGGPGTPAARTELLSALLRERYQRPPLWPVESHPDLIARRRAILLGKDIDHG